MHSRGSLDQLQPPGCCDMSSFWPSCRTCLGGKAAAAGGRVEAGSQGVLGFNLTHLLGSWVLPIPPGQPGAGCPGPQWHEISEEPVHSKSSSRPRLSGGNPSIPGVEGWLQICSKVDLCWSPSPSWVPLALKSHSFLELGRRAKPLVPGVVWMGGRFTAPS